MNATGADVAAAYVRVSTPDQSCDAQLSTLREFAARSGLKLPADHTYADLGASGRTSSRPGFDGLRAAIVGGEVNVVLITKLDRIARSVRTALEFFDQAESAGVRVVVTDQGFDTGTPSGRLVRTMLAAIAEFEGELIRDRTRAAMAEILSGRRPTRSGRPPGRPRKVTPELRDRILALREEGKTWNEIARSTHLRAGTCRKVPAASRAESPCVVNGRRGIATPTVDSPPQSPALRDPQPTGSERGAP